MHKLRSRLAAFAAILLATLVAATAAADPGTDSYDRTSAGDTPNGGTAAEQPPTVQPSGGVAGPAAGRGAGASQVPHGSQDEEPPQVEPPPDQGEEPEPEEEAPEEQPDEVPEDVGGEAPTGTGAAPSGGGLPTTGLGLAALVAIGAGLLLAGLALRRRPG